jgi:hypothetical protein
MDSIQVDLSIQAPGNRIKVGGRNPVILKGRVTVPINPKQLAMLITNKGLTLQHVTFGKVSNYNPDTNVATAHCHLPENDTKEAIDSLVAMGFIVDQDALRFYNLQ